MIKRRLLYLYEGSHEIIEVIPHTHGPASKRHRAYFILDLDSGLVLKDRYTGDAGAVYEPKVLKYFWEQYGNKVLYQLPEDLFKI